ncbi:MAG: transcriptional regulator [Candidatus Freyrarchaeum guaymaensis]|nr:transcriptional regulator [Candidatus Sigynarchaeota archaeon]
MSISKSNAERLARRVAGEISLSDDPGKMMRKWRELFHVPQIILAEYLDVSPSVISDYEGSRRKSPGTKTIRRFVEGLLAIDEKNGGQITAAFSRLMSVEIPTDIILDIREFTTPVNSKEFCAAIKAECVVGEEFLDRNLLGYIVIDSISAFRELSGDAFLKLYEATSERGVIFTNASTGRSPLITIKINTRKPSLIVLHGLSEPDPLAIELAKKEGIPLAISKIESVEDLIKELRQIVPL